MANCSGSLRVRKPGELKGGKCVLGLMSGVRRAMLEMGLATCCVLCDAPDDIVGERGVSPGTVDFGGVKEAGKDRGAA